MFKRINNVFVAILFFLGICLNSYSQNYTQSLKSSFIEIHGTSTIHDWIETAEEFSTSLSIDSLSIKKLQLKVTSESIKSGKGLMDKLTYKALKTDKYKHILFSFVTQDSIIKINENQYNLIIKGNLTIAGETKLVRVKMAYTKNASSVVLEGSKKILMTDYGVQPPKALMGTIKTGDEVNIKFKINFNHK